MSCVRTLLATALPFLVLSIPAGGSDRDPTAAECNNRGVDFCNQQKYDKALREFNKALRLNPYYGLAYRNRAVTYVQIGAAMPGRSYSFYRQAASDYGIALLLDPKDADIYRERGQVYTRMGDADRAIADFTQALKLKPEMAAAYRGRSKAYRDKGDIDRALADLERAMKLEGRH